MSSALQQVIAIKNPVCSLGCFKNAKLVEAPFVCQFQEAVTFRSPLSLLISKKIP
jgi:hypothetical protein